MIRDYVIGMALWFMAIMIALLCNWQLAFGASVHLAWDHDGAEGYRLYMSESGQPMSQVWQGSEKTTALDLTEGVTYQFTVTAYTGRLESAQSDILQYTVPPEQKVIIVDGQPTALRIEFR